MMKLTNEDKDDLLKYARYFALKAAQIIVSSRQKEKKSTPCRQKSDWFNLNIAAINESDANVIRRTVTNRFFRGVPVCVEIYAESSDGELLVETWCIRLSPEYSDPNPKITTFNVYNQIGILLKSLLSVTRIIPAFRLSLMTKETCDMHYRMYEEEPDFGGLGDDCKQITIGRIFTPIGTLQITVDYKPKIIITQTSKPSVEESSMIYESNYFSADSEPKSKFTKNYQGDDKPLRYTIPFAGDYFPAPTKKTIPALRPGGIPWYPKSYHEKILGEEKPNCISCADENTTQETNLSQKLNKTESSSPSDSLVIREMEPKGTRELSSSGKSLSSEYMINVMSKYRAKPVPKSMCYPFANETPESEISHFYRECSNPPLLTCWKQSSSVKDIDITEQLNAFEEKIKEFDDLVKSLSASPDSDN
ncbi:autophagy-related protein 13 homolog [Coccinella septempunctata]|uniref:autophagy-related protein 13 homolog n=1 Tax=Coccinella septempunctata TaxID=41139 RepID=UPI001D05E9B3|nr:autophagy-related protein 13 homolog [Coccinella septempunctata]